MANFKEGLDAFTNKEYDKAIELLSPFAEEGDAEAQFYLAKIYENGYGVSKDIEKAIKWYQLASKGGNPKAQNNLVLLYEEGIGVLEGYKDTGLFLLRNAAKKGADRAQYNLADRYKKINFLFCENVNVSSQTFKSYLDFSKNKKKLFK